MQDNQNNVVSLPENAYRELKPGEEYIPVIPASQIVPQVTVWSVLWGLVMAVIFSAAAAYSGLKIGQVMEAAIPISIIAVGVSTLFKKKFALSQNVIIQSIGASSGVIVAGAVFTIPGLYILNLPVNFFQIFFSSLFGGFLGILFLIPFRKYFVKEMHGKFPFPEATATTEILITGEKGGSQAGLLVTSGLIGGIYDFLFQSFQLWSEVFTSRIVGIGQVLAEKTKILLQFNVSAMIVGFGYLVGLKYALIITLGSFLSWWVFVPLINQIGNIAAQGGGINIFAAMSPEQIFTDYVRHIGIGAIAMAGIIGVIKAAPVIGKAFSLAAKGIFGGGISTETEERTQSDLKMTYVIMFIALTIIAIFIFFLTGFEITLVQAIIALLTVVIISFLFTTVAANAIAIVGSNPVSGMTLMTLILASVVLSSAGLTGDKGMIAALIMGGIVCTALSMAGGFVTDLKIGYWIGTTPKKQE
ncbi:oligopeptide transporter, OPT family, partial [bacterium]|nr:oligopeptide transporter, OPT family [bacterium]